MKTWNQMNAGARKGLKRAPAQFCTALRRWLDAGLEADVAAALTSALTSDAQNTVSISDLLLHLDWTIEELASVALRTGVAPARIRNSQDDRAGDLQSAMTAMSQCNDQDAENDVHIRPIMPPRREDRRPYVLSFHFLVIEGGGPVRRSLNRNVSYTTA